MRYKNIPGNFRRYTAKDGKALIAESAVQPVHHKYLEQLFDERWIRKRNDILKRDKHRCKNCGSAKNLEVHHRQYEFLVKQNRYRDAWDYNNDLLVTLCHQCNTTGHSKFQIPTKKIWL